MTAHYRDLGSSVDTVDGAQYFAVSGLLRPGSRSFGLYRDGVKRAIDLALVILSFPVTLPLMMALALMVALDGGRPFYSQERVGRGGRIYTMWKLRSMVPDAETKLEAHLASDAAARAEWDSTQKLKDDPRITKFGRFLRKSSFDELPQLLNVLIGDMSLVGPRPMMPEQEILYPGTAYFDLRPGVTGYWQISDRNNSTFAERAIFDTRYNKDVSLSADVATIAATFKVVLRGTGY